MATSGLSSSVWKGIKSVGKAAFSAAKNDPSVKAALQAAKAKGVATAKSAGTALAVRAIDAAAKSASKYTVPAMGYMAAPVMGGSSAKSLVVTRRRGDKRTYWDADAPRRISPRRAPNGGMGTRAATGAAARAKAAHKSAHKAAHKAARKSAKKSAHKH